MQRMARLFDSDYFPINHPYALSPIQVQNYEELKNVIKKHHLEIEHTCVQCKGYTQYKEDVYKFRRKSKALYNIIYKYLFHNIVNMITAYISDVFVCHKCQIEQTLQQQKRHFDYPRRVLCVYPHNRLSYTSFERNSKHISIPYGYNNARIKCPTYLTDDDIWDLLIRLDLVEEPFTWPKYKANSRGSLMSLVSVEKKYRSLNRHYDIPAKKEKRMIYRKMKEQSNHHNKLPRTFKKNSR